MTEKLSPFLARKGVKERYSCPVILHWCPACEVAHAFAITIPFHNGAKWSWNNDPLLPTFSPSMNISIGPYPPDGKIDRCHYILTDGMISFCEDSTHKLSGKKVHLPMIPPQRWKAWGIDDADDFGI